MNVEQHHNIKLCKELLATSRIQSYKNDQTPSALVALSHMYVSAFHHQRIVAVLHFTIYPYIIYIIFFSVYIKKKQIIFASAQSTLNGEPL
jgi:hypothetical protein